MMLDSIVVAISGGAGRIGSAFSRKIVENGGRVIIGDVKIEKGHQLVSELGKDKALFVEAELTQPEGIHSLIKAGREKFNKIDAAVHCAYPVSKQWGTRFEDLKGEDLKEDLFNQLGGAIIFSQGVISYFKEQGYGNLVHISSIHGIYELLFVTIPSKSKVLVDAPKNSFAEYILFELLYSKLCLVYFLPIKYTCF